jgi:hypothetical protein
MGMKNNERIVQFYDLDLYGKTRTKGVDKKFSKFSELQKAMEEIKSLRELNLARSSINSKSKWEIRLEDLEERNDCWVLLINIVDTEAAHPVIQKMGGTDDDRDVIELDAGKGLESSAHVVIYKKQNKAKKYLTLYERTPSLSFAKIVTFINALFRTCSRQFKDAHTLPHPSGEVGKTILIYRVANYFGHPSSEFMNEIKEGKLISITLTSDMTVVKGYDANKHPDLIGTDVKMSVSAAKIIWNGGNWGHVKKALSYADSLNSPFVRIQFTDKTGTGHSAIMSTDTKQLADADKYVKKCKISGFSVPLRTAFPVIQDKIRDKMLGLVK